tara:strand:+ start:145 stop:288 length:144 start_codon:yes stop_codon:yes gene_type:complete
MIQVIKGFYKLSEKKTYIVGDKVSFTKVEETGLIRNGFAKVVTKTKK